MLNGKGFSLAHGKGRATLLALKVITCEELAHFFPNTCNTPFVLPVAPSHADKVHSLAGASHEGGNL